MSTFEEDKKLEEYIQQVFSEYTVSVSEEQKSDIIEAFQRIKFHNKRMDFSLNEIVKNKTFLLLILSILGVSVLIYIFAFLFPADRNKENQRQKENNIQPALPVKKEDSLISNFQQGSISKLKDSSHQKTEANTKDGLKKDTSVLEEDVHIKKDRVSDHLNTDNKKEDSVSVKSNDSVKNNENAPEKKKKRKKKKEITDSVNEEVLPVLKPKPPDLGPDTNETD